MLYPRTPARTVRERVSSLACDTTRVDVCGRASGRAAAARRHGTPDTLRAHDHSRHRTFVVPKRRRQGRDLYLSSYPDFKLSEFDARHSDSRETVLGRESPARVYNACSVAYRRLTFSIAHPSTVPEAQPQARGRARLQSLIRNHRIRITDEGGAASGAPTREPRRAARPPA